MKDRKVKPRAKPSDKVYRADAALTKRGNVPAAVKKFIRDVPVTAVMVHKGDPPNFSFESGVTP